MTRHIKQIFLLLTASASFLSCSATLMEGDVSDMKDGSRIVITGTVSDASDNYPIEDIKVVFKAYLPETSPSNPVTTLTEYTGSNGIYTIHAEGLGAISACTLTAEDETGTYATSSTRINVTWSGTAYDKESNTFVVNGCNFHLEKAK